MTDGKDSIDAFLTRERLPPDFRVVIDQVHRPVARYLLAQWQAHGRCLMVGICGCQGSGKSTMARSLEMLIGEAGLRVAVLSIDDLYYSHARRAELAATVHPLLATRGVPGTHDVAAGMALFDALCGATASAAVRLPRFDKASDDPAPADSWLEIEAPVDMILFEGWCVGAVPQDEQALLTPVNALEREEDAGGVWRRYVNAALAGPYQSLFSRLDQLILLRAPGFEVVRDWRLQQEEKLRRQLKASGGNGPAVMDAAQVERFIAHYERLTRHILAEMPARADVVVPLDALRRIDAGEILWR